MAAWRHLETVICKKFADRKNAFIFALFETIFCEKPIAFSRTAGLISRRFGFSPRLSKVHRALADTRSLVRRALVRPG